MGLVKVDGAYCLNIRGCSPIYLIATQNNQIWSLVLKKLGHKVKSPWVGLARTALILVGNSIAAAANTRTEVQIG
jgi:precorrin-4 methylase